MVLEVKSSNEKEAQEKPWWQQNLFLQMGISTFGCTMNKWFIPWDIRFHSNFIASNERALDEIFILFYFLIL